MKKVFALAALALVVVSCKKECPVLTTSEEGVSTEKQVQAIIKKNGV